MAASARISPIGRTPCCSRKAPTRDSRISSCASGPAAATFPRYAPATRTAGPANGTIIHSRICPTSITWRSSRITYPRPGSASRWRIPSPNSWKRYATSKRFSFESASQALPLQLYSRQPRGLETMKNVKRKTCLLILSFCLLFPSCRCANQGKGDSAENGPARAPPDTEPGAASGAGSGGTPSAQGPESGTVASPQADASSATAPAPPKFDAEAGPHPGNIAVAITAEAGATIRYSLDGSLPGIEKGRAYTEPLALDSSVVVTAVAIKGQKASRPAVRTYTLKEVCVAPGGSGPGR